MRPPPKKCEDFPMVCQWTKKQFRCTLKTLNNASQGETDGNATSTWEKGKHRCPHKDTNNEDSKTSHFYLEDADGVPVSKEQIMEMSHKARSGGHSMRTAWHQRHSARSQ
jgi:hypothetical protein